MYKLRASHRLTLFFSVHQIAANQHDGQPSDSQSTQIAPIVSRQLSHRPPVPLFDETPGQYRQRSVAAGGRPLETVIDEDQTGEMTNAS